MRLRASQRVSGRGIPKPFLVGVGDETINLPTEKLKKSNDLELGEIFTTSTKMCLISEWAKCLWTGVTFPKLPDRNVPGSRLIWSYLEESFSKLVSYICR